jgi:hypothetical protein
VYEHAHGSARMDASKISVSRYNGRCKLFVDNIIAYFQRDISGAGVSVQGLLSRISIISVDHESITY